MHPESPWHMLRYQVGEHVCSIAGKKWLIRVVDEAVWYRSGSWDRPNRQVLELDRSVDRQVPVAETEEETTQRGDPELFTFMVQLRSELETVSPQLSVESHYCRPSTRYLTVPLNCTRRAHRAAPRKPNVNPFRLTWRCKCKLIRD